MNDEQKTRYNRQIILHNFGEEAQEKLLNAKVLVIGAGGLGCPALQYLAAAGVGTIGIVDGDTISLSNLHRQILFTNRDIGKNKTTAAAKQLKKANPEIIINEYPFFITTESAIEIIRHYDIVVDCTDNFATRYLINDASVLMEKPLIFGAIYQYEGQVAVFNLQDENGIAIQYRHLFPVPTSKDDAPDCSSAGVLGILPGIIGIMQATETIKIITGIGAALINKIATYNALTNDLFTIDITESYQKKISAPQNESEFKKMDYEAFCSSHFDIIRQIDADDFSVFVKKKNVAIIDVRELNEMPLAKFRHQKFPFSEWKNLIPEITENEIVIFCQSGKRSVKAAQILYELYGSEKKIYSLQDGILSLKQNDNF